MASLQRQWHLTPVDPQLPFDPEALMRRAPPFHMEEDDSLPEHLARVQRDAPGLPMVRVPPQFTELTLSSHHGAGANFSTTLGQFELIITEQRHARAVAARLTQLGNLLDNTDLTDELTCAVMIGHTTLLAEQISWNADSRELILTGQTPMTWVPEVLERWRWRSLSGLMRLSLPVHDRGTHNTLAGTPHAGHDELGRQLIGLGAAPATPPRRASRPATVTPPGAPASPQPSPQSTSPLATINAADDFELWEDPDESSPAVPSMTGHPTAPSTPAAPQATHPGGAQTTTQETPPTAFEEADNPWEGWDLPEPEQPTATADSSGPDQDWAQGEQQFEPQGQPLAGDPDAHASLEGQAEWPSDAETDTDADMNTTQAQADDQRFKLNRSEPFLIPTSTDDDLDDDLDTPESSPAEPAPVSPAPVTPAPSAARPAQQARTGRTPTRPAQQAAGASQRAVVEAAVRAGLNANPSSAHPEEEEYSDPALRAPSARTAMTGKRAEALKRASEPRKREQSDKTPAPDAREVARALGFALERIPPRMLKVAIFLAAMMIAMLIFLFVAGR